jgi:hypothetical protein
MPIETSLPDRRWSRGLGGLSLALGAAPLAAPRQIAKLIGVPERRALLYAVGVRELLAGVGLLATRRKGVFAWARVAGDLMDIALLGTGFAKTRSPRAAGALGFVLGVTVLDLIAARRLAPTQTIHASVTVDRPLHEVEALARSLPRPRGQLSFTAAPSSRGTELHLQSTVSREAAQNDLRHLKQLIEVGEIVHSDASIHRGPHPAQPSPMPKGARP